MRLWHYKLIGALPKSQLLAQWRELNSIFKKQDRHILINYIYDHPKEYLKVYADKVVDEMAKRGYKIKSFANYDRYFVCCSCNCDENYPEHDDEYLTVCYWNLREKYKRGQKDFTADDLERIQAIYKGVWL